MSTPVNPRIFQVLTLPGIGYLMRSMKKRKPSPRQRAKAALTDLIKQAGGPRKLGAALDLKSTNGPHYWDVLPDKHLPKACQVFDKEPKQLRPDLTDFQIRKAMEAGAVAG